MNPRAIASVFSVSALLAAPAVHAHGDPSNSAQLAWTFDAWVTAPLIVSLLWFFIGYIRLQQRSSAGALHVGSARWFVAGWLTLAVALVTPLHEAGQHSFAAHMLEHELLMLVAAPLLVMSRPIGIGLWAFPHRSRRLMAAAGQRVGGAWRFITLPVTATLLQASALWLWHAPRLFDLALVNAGWHVVQHLSFLICALLFWWAVLHGRVAGRRVGVAVGCLFFTAVVSGALGALMAFSSSPWYAGYASTGLNAYGMTPAEDQQLAGLLMWIPGGLVHALAGLTLLARRLSRDDREHANAFD